MRFRSVRSVLVVIALGLLASGCGGGDDAPPGEDGAAQSAREIVVEARDSRFVPDRIEIAAGETVTLVLRNVDTATDHDLQAVDLEVMLASDAASGHGTADEHEQVADANSALAVHVAAGEDGSITFVADEPGTYRIFCTVDDHEEQGMVGTIVVT